jgi:hypothetical protein
LRVGLGGQSTRRSKERSQTEEGTSCFRVRNILLLFCLRRLAGGTKTRWTLVPLVDDKKLGATELVMDAIARLPMELQQDLWKPASLLLRPNPPGPSQTDLLLDFTVPRSEGLTLAEFDVTKLRTEVYFQNVSLTDAVQQLQPHSGPTESTAWPSSYPVSGNG